MLQLTINFANPVPPSNRAEFQRLGAPPLGPNMVLIHNFSRNEKNPRQHYQTYGDEASEHVMTTSKEIPFLLQGGTFDDTNNFVNPPSQVPTETPASQQKSSSSDSAVVDLPLFYPPLPNQPQHRPTSTHYGTLRETFNPHPGNLNSPPQSSFTPFKPNLFGFPVITNTRENVGHQINW